MIPSTALCDVSRYAALDYQPYPSSPSDAFNPIQRGGIKTIQQRIVQSNSGDAYYPSVDKEIPPHLLGGSELDDVYWCSNGQLLASHQMLVSAFLLESSSATLGDGGLYPMYGCLTADGRRAALQGVMKMAGADTQLPNGAGETRDHYWLRLARHYINKGMESCARHQLHKLGYGGASDDSASASCPEDSFYLIDLGCVVEQMARWRHWLPMVRPHFAVKCNPDLLLMRTLAAAGVGFSCDSRAEIELVLNNKIVNSTDDIIFANPCKQPTDLRCAAARGVQYVVFDNPNELKKLARYLPNAKAVLRIKTRDASALSTKYGASLESVDHLLQTARDLHVEVCGVSFHVGSRNADLAAYTQTLHDAHYVFERAACYGFNCTLLDIGGGYPGVTPTAAAAQFANGAVSFESIAAVMRPMLDDLFSDVTVLSEAGRFFTEATHAVVMNVFATRRLRMTDSEKAKCQAHGDVVSLDGAEEYQYYVNDGLYNSFCSIVFDDAHPQLLLRPLHISTIFGPTCDSLDCIVKQQPFPEMHPGDWLVAPNMGSYTTALGSDFNGFSTKRRVYICSVEF